MPHLTPDARPLRDLTALSRLSHGSQMRILYATLICWESLGVALLQKRAWEPGAQVRAVQHRLVGAGLRCEHRTALQPRRPVGTPELLPAAGSRRVAVKRQWCLASW